MDLSVLNGSSKHTSFECVRWNDDMRTLEVTLGCTCIPGNIVARMMESETNWSATASYVEKVLRKKKIEDKERITVRTITQAPPMGS